MSNGSLKPVVIFRLSLALSLFSITPVMDDVFGSVNHRVSLISVTARSASREGAARTLWLPSRTPMPAITVRRVPLASTRGYDAPRGLPRVHMRPNGVQMLAAVNGRGAYEDMMSNGPRRKAKKSRRKAAKSRRYATKARSTGISSRKRAKYRRKSAKASRRSSKLKKKAEFGKYIKRMAHKAGMTRKQLKRLLKGEGLTSKQVAACVGSPIAGGAGEVCKISPSKQQEIAAALSEQARGGSRELTFNGRPEIYFDNRSEEHMESNGRRRRRKARKSGRKSRRASARRSSRRSSSRGRRSSARRRSTKRSRSRGRRSSSRGRRRGFRRNGSDEFEMNPYSENGHEFEANGDDDFEMNAKKRGKKRKSGGGDKKFAKLFRQAMGVPKGASGEAYMGQVVLDRFADQALAGQITAEQYKQLRKQIAKSAFPKQTGKGAVIPVRIQDPFTGKSKVVKVKWNGKVHNAFGPYERKRKGGALTYLVKGGEKGERFPDYALVGAYSDRDNAAMAALDPEWRVQAEARAMRIAALREKVRDEEMKELEEKIARLRSRSGKVNDPMTPNKRGSRRRGRRRLSAKQRAAALRNLRKARASKKRRSYGRKSRKSGRRSARRGRKVGRRKARRSSGRKSRRSYGRKGRKSARRSSRKGRKYGRRRGRKAGRRRSHRRGRKAGRRGRRGFRRNATEGAEFLLAAVGAGVFGVLSLYATPQVASALSFAGEYASPLASLLLGGLAVGATLFVGKKLMEEEKTEALALGMAAAAGGGVLFGIAQKAGIAGIPYVNTSGWGSRRPVGAYELRGTGAYELRGLGAYPQQALAGSQYAQALAAYELRGLGAYPQQALAGSQYAQALAAYELRGLGQQPYDQEILPSHADSALDWADQNTEGEYVNSQLQPPAPLFFQDSLANLGVPSDSGGGIPSVSIWNPTGDAEVDPSAGIFADPNV